MCRLANMDGTFIKIPSPTTRILATALAATSIPSVTDPKCALPESDLLTEMTHGAPDAEVRHVGDLGNFEANRFGVGVVDVSDRLVSLIGPAELNVIGRTMVIHAGEDDLGLGGNPESLKTGNAGARVGCCIITPYEL